MKKLCPVEDFIPAHIYSPAQTEHKKDSVIGSLSGKTLTLPSIYTIYDVGVKCPGFDAFGLFRASQPFVFLMAYLFFREIQISSRFCALSGPMGLPPVVIPHPARMRMMSSICPLDSRVFFPKIKLFIIRIFA